MEEGFKRYEKSPESQRLNIWSNKKENTGVSHLEVTGDLRERNFNRRIGALVQLPQNEEFMGKKWKSQRKAIL